MAASTITPLRAENPSISVRIWFSVCSRSSWPPEMLGPPAERERPIASSSSMKMIAGAAALACWNRSRTREAPTPTIISTNSEADIWKNGTPASPATARASSVLPVPGAPLSSTPRGMRPPSLRYLSGFFRKSTISVSSSLASSIPATSENVTCCSSASTRRARERPNDISPPAPPPPAARRIRKMNSATSRIVGPNPKIRLVKNDGPESGDLASIVTLWSCSSFDNALLSANDGTWVEKLTVAVAFLSPAGYVTALPNSPWIESPVEEISLTLLFWTWVRNVGL